MRKSLLILLALYVVTGFYHQQPPQKHHQSYKVLLSSRTSGINFPDEWFSFKDCQILMPEQKVPRSIIHFIGGVIAGSVVPLTYSELLTSLAKQGHMIVVTTIPPVQSDHYEIASNVAKSLIDCYASCLPGLVGSELPNVPLIGLSHSLGGKLMTLVNSNKKYRRQLPRRSGNVFLAFNNYDFNQSMTYSTDAMKRTAANTDVNEVMKSIADIQSFVQDISSSTKAFGDLLADGSKLIQGIDARRVLDSFNLPSETISDDMVDQFNQVRNQVGQTVDAAAKAAAKDITQFKPSPKETWQIMAEGYNIQRNVLFKFVDDDIDQSCELEKVLRSRGCDVVLLELQGNHLTPNLMLSKDQIEVEDNTSVSQGTTTTRPGRLSRYLPMALNRLLTEVEDQELTDDINRERRYLKG